VRVFVDGLPEEVREGASVAEVLEQRGDPTHHVMVEINGSFVHPKSYDVAHLRAGDRMEVVYPAFGG
jgi:thiamine biosynthesis protein ThiS